MNYWLFKSEPNTYSWEDMKNDGSTHWDGVRNYQARNCMKDMKKGDKGFFYHSVKERTIVGTVEVVKEYYQDPTTDDDRWVVVDIKALSDVKKPITLDDVKSHAGLEEMVLVKNSRLSVQPVKKEEWDAIHKMMEE